MTAKNIPTLKTETRQGLGSKACALGRDDGKIPAQIYGHAKENQYFWLDGHDLELNLRDKPTLVLLELENGPQHAVFKEVQYGPFGKRLRHVDFQRVNTDEVVTATVSLSFHGTPAGADEGGVLEAARESVRIKVRADSVPDSLPVSVVELKLGDKRCCKDVNLPDGARLMEHPDSVVCRVRVPRRIKIEAAAPAAGAAAPVEAAKTEAAAKA